jgi:hypothetical protein
VKRTGSRHTSADLPPLPEVTRITSVKAPTSSDSEERIRRYLIQMGLRVACFIGAVVIDHWTRWLLVVAAVVLPYIAVVLVNAGQERGSDPGTYLPPPGPPVPPALTGGSPP